MPALLQGLDDRAAVSNCASVRLAGAG